MSITNKKSISITRTMAITLANFTITRIYAYCSNHSGVKQTGSQKETRNKTAHYVKIPLLHKNRNGLRSDKRGLMAEKSKLRY